MNTLTTEQKARVFAMHYGCDMQVVTSIDSITGKPSYGALTGIFEGVQVELQLVEGRHLSETPDYFDFNVVALLLRPLSAITDEDARQVMKIQQTGFYCSESDFNVTEKALSYRHKTDGHWHLYDLAWDCMYSETAQFLAARGYAIPIYIAPGHPDNGKTAIQLGLAIEMPA